MMIRNVRSVEAQVLGYVIERLEQYDSAGSLQSTQYVVQCPHTGNRFGQHSNLRMAKRFVIMHELCGITLRKRRGRMQHASVRRLEAPHLA